jgi:MurNAc alpha-1-phosphate uridylyltransferase
VSAPTSAMVLAAGLGKRMRPITETMPKPMVPVAGKPLIDWGLDALASAGVNDAVVNVHYLPDQLIGHLKHRVTPRIVISDERDLLLDSGGGIVHALPELGAKSLLHPQCRHVLDRRRRRQSSPSCA